MEAAIEQEGTSIDWEMQMYESWW